MVSIKSKVDLIPSSQRIGNQCGLTDCTLLSEVCSLGNINLVKMLLETLNNPNPNKRIQVNKVWSRKHPVEHALKNGHCEIAKLLLSATDSNGLKIVQPIHCKGLVEDQCRYGSDSEFMKFLLLETDFGSTLKDVKYSPLHLACQDADIVKVLLSHPDIDINCCFEGSTPLMEACSNGNPNVVRVLLQTLNAKYIDNSRTVKVNVQNDQGDTALHLACQSVGLWDDQCFEVVKLLLDTLELQDINKRVKLDLKNNKGQTALEVARNNNLRFVNYEKIRKYWEHEESPGLLPLESIISLLEKGSQK